MRQEHSKAANVVIMTEPKARLLLQLAAEECSTIHDRSEAEVMKAFKMEKFMTEAKLRS